jgi:Uma2 family endonuclease
MSAPILLRASSVLHLSSDEFFAFCQENKDLRIERKSTGEICIDMPTKTETGRLNALLIGLLYAWVTQAKTGYIFDSSSGFTLPSGSVYSPDASWVKKERYDALTKEEKFQFAPLCPDLVAEIRSSSDNLKPLQEKMEEYIANGALLGILLDPKNKIVHLYRPNQSVQTLENPISVSCEPEMPGLVLDMTVLFAD